MKLDKAQLSELDGILTDQSLGGNIWGIRVEDLDGHTIFDLGGARNMMPASNMKLFSTALALDLLGPDHVFETQLLATGNLAEGRLTGNIVVIGSGDPVIAPRVDGPAAFALGVFEEWAKALHGAGLREVTGSIIGDGRCFSGDFWNTGWEWGFLYDSDSAGSSGLSAAENSFAYTITPGDTPGAVASISITPGIAYIEPLCEVVTGAPGSVSDSHFLSTTNPLDNRPVFRGSIAVDAATHSNRGSVYDGAAYTAALLRDALQQAGIHVIGPGRSATAHDPSPTGVILHQHRSPRLAEIIPLCNKPSNNFIADMLLKAVALKVQGEGSYAGGEKAMREWLRRHDVPEPDALSLIDGSGLARRNLLQPRQATALLRAIWHKPVIGEVFRHSLPVSVETPDASANFPNLPPGRVFAKTGLIEAVRALSGYAIRDTGETFVFSIIANHHSLPWREMNRYIERVLLVLLR